MGTKRKFFPTVQCQVINVKGKVEIERYHLALIIIVANSGRSHLWMPSLWGQVLMQHIGNNGYCYNSRAYPYKRLTSYKGTEWWLLVGKHSAHQLDQWIKVNHRYWSQELPVHVSWYRPLTRAEITNAVSLPKWDSSSLVLKKHWMGHSEDLPPPEGKAALFKTASIMKNRERQRNRSRLKGTGEIWQLNAQWVPELDYIPKRKGEIVGIVGRIWMRFADWTVVVYEYWSLDLDSYIVQRWRMPLR